MQELYSNTKSSKKKASGDKKTSFGNSYRVLVKPLITEKSSNQSVNGVYFFEVNINTNKIEVAKAIKDVYGINPAKVNIIKMEGKTKVRGRVTGKRKDWKKAIVFLPKGKTIDVYEGV